VTYLCSHSTRGSRVFCPQVQPQKWNYVLRWGLRRTLLTISSPTWWEALSSPKSSRNGSSKIFRRCSRRVTSTVMAWSLTLNCVVCYSSTQWGGKWQSGMKWSAHSIKKSVIKTNVVFLGKKTWTRQSCSKLSKLETNSLRFGKAEMSWWPKETTRLEVIFSGLMKCLIVSSTIQSYFNHLEKQGAML